jgi:hypothetical protein
MNANCWLEDVMIISLSQKTQRLLKRHMQISGDTDPDLVLRRALETLNQLEGLELEALDAPTRRAIQRASAQSARKDRRPWKAVKEELCKRFLKSSSR